MILVLGLSLLPIGISDVRAEIIDPSLVGGNTATLGAVPVRTSDQEILAQKKAAEEKRQRDAAKEIGLCSVTSGNGIAICISNLVYFVMVGVFSSLAYIAAFFFDLAVQLSLSSTTYALGFINTSWVIVRDLSNMAFIFILIYIAIKVMLEADTSDTLKMLAGVVVVALLVNFSFFFTRVAIDAGNLLALQFYNAIDARPIGSTASDSLQSVLSGGGTNGQAPAAALASNFTSLASKGETKDLTASIMDGIQVQNILNSPSFKKYAEGPQSGFMFTLISLSTIYIAVGIAFGILAGAFLFAGAKFLMRIIGLWFLIIFSPLALVAQAVPQGKGLFKMWLTQLVNFTFYPAVFLFMFFILTKFMKELNEGGNFLSAVFSQQLVGDSANSFFNILTSIANVGIRLGFVIGMMYLALSAADMLAKMRKDVTTPWARKSAGWMGNMITGGAVGAVGRQTLGRFGRLIGNERLANSTYDIRNSRVAKATLIPSLLKGYEPATEKPHGKLGALPVDYGEAPEKGFGLSDKQIKERQKAKDEKERIEKKKAERAENRKLDEEDAAKKTQQNSSKTTPPPPTTAPNTSNSASPANGGGGPSGGSRPNNTQGTPAATTQNTPRAPQTTNASNSTPRASTTIDAANLGKILKQLKQDGADQTRGAYGTPMQTINTSKVAEATLPPTVTEPTHEASLSEEALKQMKTAVRGVIQKENALAHDKEHTTSPASKAPPTSPTPTVATPSKPILPDNNKTV